MADSSTLEELSHASYWNKRYQRSGVKTTYEWFRSFGGLTTLFAAHLPAPSLDGRTPRILHPGCGNSMLPIDLHKHGYKNQVCLDFSNVVIKNMASQFEERDGIEWIVGDIRDMSNIGDGEFDVVIDKGTLDSMISGSVWNPPDEVKHNTRAYIDEVVRTLKPRGIFLCITYRQPHFVKPMLERDDIWEISVMELVEEAGSFGYFGFIMRRC
ncbi:MAG: hypothetical protein M1816_001686 [Peltula sp. TS41687]|nr:MAG: hypothetical protein M1816_001686 [Peltula sp. TS41687]